MHGSMLVPIILGADKTVVSVATGTQEFHPLYASAGNVWNDVRRAHGEAVVPLAFLAVPKSMLRQLLGFLLPSNHVLLCFFYMVSR